MLIRRFVSGVSGEKSEMLEVGVRACVFRKSLLSWDFGGKGDPKDHNIHVLYWGIRM